MGVAFATPIFRASKNPQTVKTRLYKKAPLQGSRRPALPVTDEAGRKRVPRSVCNAGVRAKAHAGHRKRMLSAKAD